MISLLVLSVFAADSLVAGPIETVAEGFQFTEGPVWTSSGELIFSDIPANTNYKADKSIAYKPSGKSNGLTLDQNGRIVRCEHGNRRVVRIEVDDSITVLADSYKGKKLNSPNDAVVRNDGTIYFTDPPYGLEGRTQEQDANGVYRLSPGGTLTRIADDFERPNGIALSPDEKRLYVADTQKSHIRAFDVAADGSVTGGEMLCRVMTPDGIRVDVDGNIWATSGRGVVVFDSGGKELEAIKFPQVPANCGFGGADGKTLFVTARTGVYSIRTTVAGYNVFRK